ncbi:MAG: hypothetical protein CSB44_10895 [Gammaproteobacteria bacterium]|nr:MAG: hypothetical protein CSB44_10895 [Gammaproteobacteria bacterium]
MPNLIARWRDSALFSSLRDLGQLVSIPLAGANAANDATPVETRVVRGTWLPTETYPLPAPIVLQAHPENPDADTEMVTREVPFLDISNASLYFDGGKWWIENLSGHLIAVAQISERPAETASARPRHLSGTSMMLGASDGANCYYHFVMELLPRLGLLEANGIAIDDIDHFLMRRITGRWQLALLEELGIGRERIVETHKRPWLRCDRLLHADLNGCINLGMHRFVVEWLQQRFPGRNDLSLDSILGRRLPHDEELKLYITRPQGVRRGVENETALVAMLEDAGFITLPMEGLTPFQQAALLARVDVLMSPHGGALTNMIWCRPGIRVVELLSRHVFPYYYGLSALCGHRYHAILENPTEDYARLTSHAIAQSYSGTAGETRARPFSVDLDAVSAMLEHLAE